MPFFTPPSTMVSFFIPSSTGDAFLHPHLHAEQAEEQDATPDVLRHAAVPDARLAAGSRYAPAAADDSLEEPHDSQPAYDSLEEPYD
jgi:hypothetical protein